MYSDVDIFALQVLNKHYFQNAKISPNEAFALCDSVFMKNETWWALYLILLARIVVEDQTFDSRVDKMAEDIGGLVPLIKGLYKVYHLKSEMGEQESVFNIPRKNIEDVVDKLHQVMHERIKKLYESCTLNEEDRDLIGQAFSTFSSTEKVIITSLDSVQSQASTGKNRD